MALGLTRSLKRRIAALHDLFALKNMHDPEMLEAAYFAEIGPGSPIVEKLCLLRKALNDIDAGEGDAAMSRKVNPACRRRKPKEAMIALDDILAATRMAGLLLASAL